VLPESKALVLMLSKSYVFRPLFRGAVTVCVVRPLV
jgi:hypothetical protein